MDGQYSLVATIGLSSYDTPNMDLDDFDKIAEQAAKKIAETRRVQASSTRDAAADINDENDGALSTMWW